MKRNDYLLLTALGAYSFLFYNQNAGLNFLLFNIVLIVIFLARNIALLKSVKWIGAAVLCLISALGILITSSELSVFANCVSLLVLSGITFNQKTSYLFSILFSVFSVLSGYIWMVLDAIKRNADKKQAGSNKNYKLVAVIISLIISLIFLIIYKEANPLFAENTKWINLDFISIQWLLFTAGGFFILYPLYYHKTIPVIENWENSLSSSSQTFSVAGERQGTENFAGSLLFAVLNLMLLLLNYGDVSTLWFNQALPHGMSHSDFVHNGVGMLILSIVIATTIILYLFRKNYTGLKGKSLIKALVYAWVLQNILMLISTCMRNQLYIHDYNLTYKRIGVYVWLALAFIGLAILFLKVFYAKSNWFLVKNNIMIWLFVLAFSSMFNWDLMITRFNLKNKPMKDIDFYYLFSLSDANLPELLDVAESNDFTKINDGLKNYTSNTGRYYERTYMDLLNTKIYRFVYSYNNDWRSFDFREHRIANSLNIK